ncbi:MAG: response regulator transcription factor [Geodermatophilaceae bacterium]|nr:response regulator transcription factor [Geodermatophilaceae bacterium]
MRVLIVDDEMRLAESIRRYLTAEGFTVDVAQDGDEGLWAATQTPYDVMILDVMLPRRNGYQVVRELREREIWIPVLMLTAKDGEYDQTDAFDLGADDYLTKPFSFPILVARLRALIRRGAPQRPTVLRAGDLTLDPARRRVTRAEQEITLTPREFGLLEILLRNQGDVLTKSEIIRSVWDENFDGDVNNVEVYIGYLRRKIDHPFRRHSIQTVRGMGYRLVTDDR